MRKIVFYLGFVNLFFPLGASRTLAQVTTGIQPLGSYGGGPIDKLNLANLNVHIDIPITSKSGRGMSFTYSLGYDSSVWTPSNTLGWLPTSGWGWTAETQGETGYVSATTALWKCFSGGSWYWATTYARWVYYDKVGTPHPFSLPTVSTCATFPNHESGTTTDGSGYQINAYPGSAVVQDVRGRIFNPPFAVGTGTGTAEDTNGNEITFNGTTFTDTLGTTALTISGTNPVDFSYTAPSGATATYVVSYVTHTVRTNFGCGSIPEYLATGVPLVDRITLPDGTYYQFTYEPTPGYSGDYTGRIASIKLPTGGTITYSYGGGSQGITCADGSTATLTRTTPDGAWQYAHSETGSAWTTAITDPEANQTTINFQDYVVSTTTYYARSEYETERQVYQGSSTLLQTLRSCYNANTSSCNTTAVSTPISQKTVFTQLPGTNNLESRFDTFFNNYGLVYKTYEYGFGGGSPGALQRQVLTSYASLGNDIQNRPSSITVEDGSNNVKAQTSYCYDEGTPSGTTTCATTGAPTATSGTPQHASITGSRGNLTTVASLISGSTTLGKTFTYFDTGKVYVATDVNGAQSTYTYGPSACPNSFPISVNEPLSLSRSMTWNCTGGVQTSVTDENGKTVSTNFTDADFWRPNSTVDQLSNTTNLTYTLLTSLESSLDYNGSTSTTDGLGTVDGLGRKHIMQTKESQSSSTYDSIEIDYDSDGRPYRTTLPYPGTSGQTCSGTCAYTSTLYDGLGRPTSTTDAGGGSLSYTYPQNDVYQTAGPQPSGENTKRKQLEYDALGRLTSVCEVTSTAGSGACGQITPATGFWTEYSYDVNNKLLGVTQNAQSSSTQTRTYAYDDLGRMTSESNPENGTTTYTYDTDSMCGTSKGDLVKKTDAVGDTICFAYDTLHRMTSTIYSGTYASVTPSRYLVYDSATVNSVVMVNVKGRLAEAYTCSSPCTTKLTDEGFSYTARGETSDIYQSTPHSGIYYHVTQTYWANGATNQLSGLSGLPTITYGVDGKGRTYSASASSGYNPLSSTSYNYANLPTAVNLGSSDSDSFSYDQNTNRMTQYSFSVNGQSVVGNLTWFPLGTLETLAVTDPFNSSDAQTCTYSHDDLARVASANCGSVWSQTFSYDAFGNINKSGSSSFGATYSTSTNRMTQIGSSAPSYDSNGNVTNDFVNTYSWDANGRPWTADSVNLTYDALGRMVEQNRSSAYTEIVYSPGGAKLALMNGSTLQKGFVALTGGSMAVYNSSGLSYYRHSDWLGSSRVASTQSRTIYYDGAYGPFGEQYAPNGTSDLSFTGQNQDTASNLYDFPAREYGIQGRWPSPDPAGVSAANLGDPQTWNRYAYVRNSPLENVDPNGMRMKLMGYTPTYGSRANLGLVDTGLSALDGLDNLSGDFPPDSSQQVASILAALGQSAGGSGQATAALQQLAESLYMYYSWLSEMGIDPGVPTVTSTDGSAVLIFLGAAPAPAQANQNGIGAVLYILAMDANGPLFDSAFSENVSSTVYPELDDSFPYSPPNGSGFTDSGIFQDTQAAFTTGGPIGVSTVQSISIYNVPNSQNYYFTNINYTIYVVGPNQGTISGNNGVSYSH